MNDSGKREQFESGAVREERCGKGRYDLISPYALKRLAIVMEKAQKNIRNEIGKRECRFLDILIPQLDI